MDPTPQPLFEERASIFLDALFCWQIDAFDIECSSARVVKNEVKLVMNQIKISAAILLNNEQQMALVRKRGSQYFMQAGGKIDEGEEAIDALIRELHEEIAFEIKAEDAHYIGKFSAPAANEAGFEVIAEIFCVKCNQELTPLAEIEQVIWVTKAEAMQLKLAPLLSQHILKLNFDELFD